MIVLLLYTLILMTVILWGALKITDSVMGAAHKGLQLQWESFVEFNELVT